MKDSLTQFKQNDQNPPYVLGKILFIEKLIGNERNKTTYPGIPFDSNPNTNYFLVYVEKVSFSSTVCTKHCINTYYF